MILAIFFVTAISVTSSNRLLSAIVIHRHGDRNPFTTYKTDPYRDESHWPEGLGQLTKRGLQRQYSLGLWLHSRYSSFLPPSYSPRSIRAVSTDVDRTLMSAEVTLAGLLPPSENQKFDENVNWQPVPIHTTPQQHDAILAMKKYCKKWRQMFDDMLNSQQIQEINNINKFLYEFLQNKTGETIKDVYDVEVIHNAIHTQFLANKSLPNWAYEVYPEKMKAAVNLRFKLPCYTRELARLRTGLLFGEIIKNFDNHVGGKEKVPKLTLYSGHDSTLSDVLTTMGAYNDEVPPYSSAILIELYQNGDFGDSHYVNIFLKNNTGLFPLNLVNCELDCNVAKFAQLLEPVFVMSLQQWEQECQNGSL